MTVGVVVLALMARTLTATASLAQHQTVASAPETFGLKSISSLPHRSICSPSAMNPDLAK